MRSFKRRLANAGLPIGRVRVDTLRAVTALKVVNVVTRDALSVSNSVVHREANAARLVVRMLKAIINKLRAVIQVEA